VKKKYGLPLRGREEKHSRHQEKIEIQVRIIEKRLRGKNNWVSNAGSKN